MNIYHLCRIAKYTCFLIWCLVINRLKVVQSLTDNYQLQKRFATELSRMVLGLFGSYCTEQSLCCCIVQELPPPKKCCKSTCSILCTRPHTTSPQKGSWGREIPLFQGNLGWWNIIIWPDFMHMGSWKLTPHLEVGLAWSRWCNPCDHDEFKVDDS